MGKQLSKADWEVVLGPVHEAIKPDVKAYLEATHSSVLQEMYINDFNRFPLLNEANGKVGRSFSRQVASRYISAVRILKDEQNLNDAKIAKRWAWASFAVALVAAVGAWKDELLKLF